MRTYIFDCFEFDSSSSEESILCAQSHSKHYEDLYSFYVGSCKGDIFSPKAIELLPTGVPIGKVASSGIMIGYLQEFCNIELEGTESFYKIESDDLFIDYVFQYKHFYVRFCWESTA